MPAPFLILTGASGAGKTTMAAAIAASHAEIAVCRGDQLAESTAYILKYLTAR